MKGNSREDPIMKEFMDNLDRINDLAETSKGFIWRLKDESGNATDINPFDDERLLVNLSVWDSIENLEEFTYRSVHVNFVRDRKKWFHHFGSAYYALWWIPKDKMPSLTEAEERLAFLREKGPTPYAFNFKQRFAAPE